jgi:hypothetical protein
MISGATGLAPMSSVVTPQLLQQGAEFVRALNSAHQSPTSAVRVRFVMEFVTNRDCPQVDLSALPEGILLVCRENWEEAMGPVFGTRNLQHHAHVQQAAAEQRQRLQASGGYLFPSRRSDAEPVCSCGGSCTSAAECACFSSQRSCSSECHSASSTSSSFSASSPHSHACCRNPLNSTRVTCAPLGPALPGQSGCKCATGCATAACGCRRAASPCMHDSLPRNARA